MRRSLSFFLPKIFLRGTELFRDLFAHLYNAQGRNELLLEHLLLSELLPGQLHAVPADPENADGEERPPEAAEKRCIA